MNAAARYAFGYARVRAVKGSLLRPDVAARLVPPPVAGVRGVVTRAPLDDVYAPLVECCRKLRDSYPFHRALFLTLLRSVEIENVKLVIRGAVRGRAWPDGCWRPLGRLATLHESDWRAPAELSGIAQRLAATPYADVVRTVLGAHPDDLFAIEVALDRWISRDILDAAAGLPKAERRTRELLLCVVRQRDVELVRRGRDAYGLEADLVLKLCALLPRESRRERLLGLATWTPSDGPLGPRIPRTLLVGAATIIDWDGLADALRRNRRRLERRCFAADPFQLAPAVALLLMRIEEIELMLRVAEAPDAAAGLRLLSDLPGA